MVRWVPCFHTNGDKYRSACEATFGGHLEPAISSYSGTPAASPLHKNNPDDHSCLLELDATTEAMFEHRFHEEMVYAYRMEP